MHNIYFYYFFKHFYSKYNYFEKKSKVKYKRNYVDNGLN